MTRDKQKHLADAFRAMHRGPLLLLPNAWDAMSARQFEAAGFAAIATTSGGVAWALGYADGEKSPWPACNTPSALNPANGWVAIMPT